MATHTQFLQSEEPNTEVYYRHTSIPGSSHYQLLIACSANTEREFKVTGYSCAHRVKCIGKCILLTKNLWYKEREQLDSGSGGALSQGAGHDRSFFFDSIIPGKLICCLAREKR